MSRALTAAGLLTLLTLAVLHALGFTLDAVAAIRTARQLDYGEGIVWQQADLIPGPRAYATPAGLPFIVFHYPPLYHLAARAARVLLPDPLAAGRLVSSAATLLIVPVLAVLAWLCVPPAQRRQPGSLAACACGALLFLAMGPVDRWGVLMRVDMLGLLFGFAGLVVAALAEGQFRGTCLALLMCLAAVFTKQSMLSFGIAVAVLSILRRPGPALRAVALVGALGIGAVLVLLGATAGGFLDNILGGNINRISVRGAYWMLRGQGPELLLLAATLPAAAWLAIRLLPLTRLRGMDVVTWRRCLLLLQVLLSCLALLMVVKVGSFANYMLELCGAGAAASAVALADVAAGRFSRLARPGAGAGVLLALLAGVLVQPIRFYAWAETGRDLDQPLVERIKAAGGPVASENMVVLMQAGVGVTYEPAIVTELASLGRFDEGLLIAAIQAHRFAFFVTTDDGSEPNDHRTPAVTAAMLAAYPRLEQLRDGLWLRQPP